jgi:hypothetical protein
MRSLTFLLPSSICHFVLFFVLPLNAFYLQPSIRPTSHPSVQTPTETTTTTKSSSWRLSSFQTANYVEVNTFHSGNDDDREVLKRRMPMVDRSHMTALEIEFRQLLEGILYTNEEMESILNSRFRAILQGIAASYYETPVYRAFEVLYEDYIPLRIAGRLVYHKLRDAMEKSREYQREQLEAVSRVTGMSVSDFKSCWSSFLRLTDSQLLPVDRLERMLSPRILRFLNCSDDDVNMAMSKLNPTGKDSLSFEELICGLYRHSSIGEGDSSLEGFPVHIVQNVMDEMGDSLSTTVLSSSSGLDKKRERYNQRYDDMLVQFGEWKEFIPDGKGRRLDILRGCFVGSENPSVVEALRIIYVDYRALRLSGDWIFNVVSTLMSIHTRQISQHKTR